MTEICKAVQDKYLETIKNATSYTGSKGGDKIISASSAFDDDLPLYLKIKHGSSSNWKFGQNTIGTLMHIGMDIAFKEHTCSKRLSIPINDEWTLSGEFDLLMDVKIDGKTYHCIIDHKLTKSSTIKKVEKEGTDHSYNMQLRLYKYLLTQTQPEIYNEYNTLMFLGASLKDGTVFVKPNIPDFEMVEIFNSISDDGIEWLLLEKANRMQKFLDLDQEPEQCKVLFWNYSAGKVNANGKKIPEPEKCLSFCDHAEFCSHGKRFKAKRDNSSLKKLLRL